MDSAASGPLPPAGNRASIKVLVVEDEPVLLERFCAAVAAAPSMTLSGAARSVAHACALADRTRPDVVLLDLGLPDGHGIDVIRHVKNGDTSRDVIVVTIFGDDGHIIDSIRAGATGYLLKDALLGDVASAIRQVRDGGSPMSPAIARRVLQSFQVPREQPASAANAAQLGDQLSVREREILRLVAKGLSAKEVGTTLGISAHTVIAHNKRIYQKLQVHSRGEAVYEANQMGLL
jgi:DNA-binding NarL/FixJ family response regulator